MNEETAAIFSELARPVHPGHVKQRRQGSIQVDYIPWHCIARHLTHRCTHGWEWSIDEVTTLGDWVMARGTLTIHTPDGAFTYTGVSSEPLTAADSKGAPPIETACSRALARAAALTGLGISLYDPKPTTNGAKQ